MMSVDMGHVEAFVFDLDDTLINWRAAERTAFERTVKRHLRPLGIEQTTADHHYERVLHENFISFRRDGTWWYAHDRLKRLLELLHIDHVEPTQLEQTYLAGVNEQAQLLPGAPQLLGALRRAGFKIGLLTNGPAAFQRRKFERLGIHHHFHYVGISGEIGHWKPDPAAFHHTLNRLGVHATSTIMVGDSLHFDIAPAQALHCQTIWMDTHKEASDPAQGNAHTDVRADLVVPTPAALHAHLGLD